MILQELRKRPWLVFNFGVREKLTSGLGTLYFTAALREGGMDATRVNLSGTDVPADVAARVPEGAVVGLHSMSGLPLQRCLSLARYLRANRRDVPIVWGGPACTFYSDLIAESGLADVIVQGEGEPFAWAVTRGLTDGIDMHRSGGVVLVATPMVADLDTLPLLPNSFPLNDLVYPYDRFGKTVYAYDMQLSRGCWGKCRFCYVGSTRYRCHSAVRLSKELDLIAGTRVEFVRFLDDTFPLSSSIVETLEGWVRSVGRSMSFFCELRLEQLENTALLRRFARIGLRDVFVGLESGDANELAELGKPIDAGCLQSRVGTMRDLGVDVFVGLLLNIPGQTQLRLDRTLRVAASANATAYYPVFVRPYPGFPLRHQTMVSKEQTVNDVANQEWLELDANCTKDIPDQVLVDAMVKLKTLPLVKRALAQSSCMSIDEQARSDHLGLTVTAGQLCLEVPQKALGTMVDRRCAHEHCNALLLWALAEAGPTEWHLVRRTALRLVNHPNYFLRALALWVIGKQMPGTDLSSEDVEAAARSLLQDGHTLVRVMARRILNRMGVLQCA